MSLLYDKLYRSADFNEASVKEYLSSLVDDILGNFPNSWKVHIEKRFQDFNRDARDRQFLQIDWIWIAVGTRFDPAATRAALVPGLSSILILNGQESPSMPLRWP